MFADKIAIRFRRIVNTCGNSYAHDCRRWLSSALHIIEMGKLREINIAGVELMNSMQREVVMSAYSCSHMVHIPVNHLPLQDLSAINLEVLEKMLATSLLCKYRATSTRIAHELCKRHQNSSAERFCAYGHCMLAYFVDEQWDEMVRYCSAGALVEYLHYQSLSCDAARDPLTGHVVAAVLHSWVRSSDIVQISAFIDHMISSLDRLDAVLIECPDALQQTLILLRQHGSIELSHRLVSFLQHNLQRRIMNAVCQDDQSGELSQVNRSINDLIRFSRGLQGSEDMKYLSNVYNFYLRKVFPRRRAYINRLVDVEGMMQCVMAAENKHDTQDFLDIPLFLTSSIGAEDCSSCAQRAAIAYDFYSHLQRHAGSDKRIKSPKIYTHLAEIIARMDVESSRNLARQGGRRGVITKTSKQVGFVRNLQKTANDDTKKTNFNSERKLLMLQKLKQQFVEDFTVGASNFGQQKRTRLTSHKHFYASYLTSVRALLRSSNCHFSKERDSVLDGVLQDLKCGGVPFGRTVEVSRALVKLFVLPHHNEPQAFSIIESDLSDLLEFVLKNRDFFQFDIVCKCIIQHLGDRDQLVPNENIETRHNEDGSTLSEQDYRVGKFCVIASDNICQFLKSLSKSQLIEEFHHRYQTSEKSMESLPVQRYKSFKECSEREWLSITLLQAACVQLFNLRSPFVLPDLMSIVISLSTQQLIPYVYWGQAIKLCEEGKQWDDLKVLVQILLYQGKMIQYASAHSVLSAYISTHSPHVGFRIARAMRREGVTVPAEAYRALCVALGRLSGRSKDGVEHAEMAEKAFEDLFDSYGPVAFTGNFDTARGVDLVTQRSKWVVNSRQEVYMKRHLKECGEFIPSSEELQRVYKEMLALLPSQYYEAGVYLITAMLSRELCMPDDADIDRFIDAAIENDRLTLAASMLRSIKHLKERYELSRAEQESHGETVSGLSSDTVDDA